MSRKNAKKVRGVKSIVHWASYDCGLEGSRTVTITRKQVTCARCRQLLDEHQASFAAATMAAATDALRVPRSRSIKSGASRATVDSGAWPDIVQVSRVAIMRDHRILETKKGAQVLAPLSCDAKPLDWVQHRDGEYVRTCFRNSGYGSAWSVYCVECGEIGREGPSSARHSASCSLKPTRGGISVVAFDCEEGFLFRVRVGARQAWVPWDGGLLELEGEKFFLETPAHGLKEARLHHLVEIKVRPDHRKQKRLPAASRGLKKMAKEVSA